MEKRVLIADDSLTIQKVVELTFADSNYRLTCVSNGRLALEKVREQAPDLILADVVMPEKNGYEVCEEIKRNPATASIPASTRILVGPSSRVLSCTNSVSATAASRSRPRTPATTRAWSRRSSCPT